MLRHLFINSIRFLKKNLRYTIFNVSVLCVGFLACLTLFIYGSFQLSYDDFHSQKDHIYSLQLSSTTSFGGSKSIFSPYPILASILEQQGGVNAVTRIYKEEIPIISESETSSELEGGILYKVDSGFSKIFNFPLQNGKWNSLFQNSNGIIVSSKFAKRLNNSNPIGQLIEISNDSTDYIVVGVLEDIPSNSSFNFDFVISTSVTDSLSWFVQKNPWIYTEIQDPSLLNNLIDVLQNEINKGFNSGIEVSSVSLKNQYFDNPLLNLNGDKKRVQTMMILTGLILFISMLNYINSYTTLLTKHSKQLGIRAILGSPKIWIILQSLVDALVIFFLAMGLALIILLIFDTEIFQLLDLNINNFSEIISISDLIFYISLMLIIVLILIPIYPFLLLKKLDPVLITRENQSNIGFGGRFRLLIVGMQIIVSITLINYTVILAHQVNFINKISLGFEKNNKILIPLFKLNMESESIKTAVNRFKNKLINNETVIGLSVNPMPTQYDMLNIRMRDNERTNFFLYNSDPSFLDVMGVELVAGRNIDEENKQSAVLINEKAANLLFPESSAVGNLIPELGDKRIVGVMQDFYFRGFGPGIGPLLVTADKFSPSNIHIKVNDINEALNVIEPLWKEFFPDQILNYTTLDNEYNRRYLDEQLSQTKLMLSAAFVAVILCSLGVFGIVGYNYKIRQKEMSIRIILGAENIQIFFLQMSFFSKTLLLSAIIGISLSYFYSLKYLENFVVRPPFPYYLLLTGLFLILIVIVSSIIFEHVAFKKNNPVNILNT